MSTEEPAGKGSTLRRYLVAGLLVWMPLLVTFWVIDILVGFMDKTLLLLPPDYRPENILGFKVPGLGVVLALSVLFLTGMLAANFVGRRLVMLWEGILQRIPLVNSVYGAVKQVMETFLSNNSKSFRKVLLIEYPRKGIWTIALLSGEPVGEVQEKTDRDVLTVFVPTTPNPTSGFIILVPRDEVIELDMTVEEGLRMIVSLGMVTPRPKNGELPDAGGAPVAPPADRA
ncbi:MAG: DUF502 domain-containing protein [Pseudomonadota bacterium]